MKYSWIVIVGLLISSFFSYEVKAATGIDLNEICSGPVGPQGRAFCEGYFVGVLDVLAIKGVNSILGICAPKNLSISQVEAIFKNWFNKFPKIWHRPAILPTMAGLRDAFPCKN